MLCPHGNHVVFICRPHGIHVETMWCPHGHHVVFMWTQHGYNMDTMWLPSGCCMVSILFSKPCAVNVETTWCPCGNHVVSTWKPHGIHMETTWCTCGYQFFGQFYHFRVTSVVIRSRKVTNLWKPVTSLIMVWFSIRKKFWKALDLLYLFVVFFVVFHCFPSFSRE